MLSSRLESWRENVQALWVKLNTQGAKGLTQDANQLFCDLFDYVYGEKHFSKRRVWASVLSSMIGLVVFTLILGYRHTIWAHGPSDELFFLMLPVLLNFIPDFFSLIETRLVLVWSKGRGLLGIVSLIVLDFALTLTIFVTGLLLFYTVLGVVGGGPLSLSAFLGPLPEIILDPKVFLVFFLTTFITSFFWLLFVLTFFLIRLFHRLSPLAKFFYYEIGQSDRPAAALLVFVNAIVIIGYVLWLGVAWVVS